MSDWSIIPTRTLVEIENLASAIYETSEAGDHMDISDNIKELVNEAVPCNVKPEGVK